MSENTPEANEPAMYLTFGGEEYEVRRENASLYMFLGNLALYNHVFIHLEDNPDSGDAIGTYVFSMHDQFESIRDYMMDNDYPLHANLLEVAECDLQAYDDMIKQAVQDVDTVPEDWR